MSQPTEDAAHHGGRKNRLAAESSPYLLLHQYNPVDWYPWGPEALEKARKEDKPIFLSVGYSTCYWCHVMERESFSNPEIAALMNEHFVNIKVDREERPDLDEIYMAATQILTQHGGWPNSVFLTPKLEPFYAGTYFPPQDRYGRPGFGSLVVALANAWKSRRGEIESQAEELASAMGRYLEERAQAGDAPPPAKSALASAEALARRFDREWGGFSQAPKFPTPSNLFLLHELAAESEEGAEMLRVTLDRMARGGIYDQLAGGFHRYATDRQWLIPHFEKMLYDNGFLLGIYAREYARTGDPEWGRITRETARFLEREMTSPEGAFYSAIDAETDGHEGAYYVWTREEVEAVVGAEDATFLGPIYGLDRPAFFEDSHWVLHLARPIDELAGARRMAPEALWQEIEPLRVKLLATRDGRKRPLTDTKILTDWNGIAIAGLAEAGRALGDPELTARAERAARFLLDNLRGSTPGEKAPTLLHTWRRETGDTDAGEAKLPAFLGDYVFLIRGLLALDDPTAEGERPWLAAAVELADEQIRRLRDSAGGFFVAAEAPDLLFRSKDIFDGATPAGNAVAALNFIELAGRTGEERFRKEAEATLSAFAPLAEQHPDAVRMMTLAAWRWGQTADGEGAPEGASPWTIVSAPGDGRRDPSSASGGDLADEAQSVVSVDLQLASTEEGWSIFTVRLTVASGWHINANPASEDFLIPTQLRGEGLELKDVRYPEGKPRRLGFAEEAISLYEGVVEIHGQARLEEGSEHSPGAILLTYQPCDEARCLPPLTRRLELPAN